MNSWPSGISSSDSAAPELALQEMGSKLATVWSEVLGIVEVSGMGLFDRPQADSYAGRGRTVTYHAPLLVGVGTAATDDCIKIMDATMAAHPGMKIILVGDNQTFKNMWWIKHNNTEKYRVWRRTMRGSRRQMGRVQLQAGLASRRLRLGVRTTRPRAA